MTYLNYHEIFIKGKLFDDSYYYRLVFLFEFSFTYRVIQRRFDYILHYIVSQFQRILSTFRDCEIKEDKILLEFLLE